MATIKLGEEHKINTAERYEGLRLWAEVTVESTDYDDVDEAIEDAQKKLAEVLEPGLDDAASVADGSSYVHNWRA